MKITVYMALISIAASLLTSCATGEETCLQECSSLSLKSQNKCALEHPNDHSGNLKCSSKAYQETNKCVGKCYGNL